MNSLKQETLPVSCLTRVPLLLLTLFMLLLSPLVQAADPDEFIVWSNSVPGRLYVPENYDASKTYPLVLFYHGLGEAGTDNVKQVNSNINNLFAECKEREAFLYAPQSSTGWWPDGTVGKCMEMVRQAIATYSIDDKRVYVTGLSAGGQGVYNTMEVHYNSIAAAVPICAAGSGERARDDKLVGLHMWFFHAANDGTVSVSQTRKAINGIRQEDGRSQLDFPLDADPDNPYYNTGSPYYTDGSNFFDEGNIRYTEYDTGGHSIWGRVYNEEPMYDWLFSKSLSASPVNRAPEVDAGLDQKLIMPMNQIAIKATYLDDGLPYPPSLTLSWSKSSGPGTVTFKKSTKASTTATFSAAGTYVLRFSVSDGDLTGYDEITVTVNPPMPDGQLYVITPLTAGTTIGSDSYLLNYAFDRQPDWDATNQMPVGGVDGSRVPAYALRQGYIDFGESWADIRIVGTWTQYLSDTTGDQSGYETMWWDDDIDDVNDSGLNENTLNFNSAQNVTSSGELLWIQDVDCSTSPVTPKGRYLILSSPATTTNRATEYAFVGYMQTGSTPVNAAPSVDAGSDQAITLPAGASLAGTVSDDGLPSGTLTTLWSKVSGPGTAVFGDASAVATSADFSIAGNYILRLTADDGELSASDDITITVTPEPIVYYTLTVSNGSGDGNYEAGEVVTVQADAAPNGQEFDTWTGDIAYLTDPVSPSTTLTIPANDVAIAATYRDLGPDNSEDANVNLALLPDAVLSGSVTGGRGEPKDILYNPAKDDYEVKTDWNEYGVTYNQSLGIVGEEDGFFWMCEWAVSKNINYITVGGCYPNQAQPNTMWKVQYRLGDAWTDLATGQGGWINNGIFAWGGAEQTPIIADAIRIRLYSDGVNDLWSVHLRGRGGVSNKINDSATPTKATLIQFLPIDNTTVNTAPSVDAGVDQTVTLPSAASLNGTISDDGLPNSVVSVQWSVISGPGTVDFSDPDSADTSASLAAAGTYVLRLTADDGELATSDDVTITVNPEPIIQYTLTVNSGSGDGDYEEGEVVTVQADAAPSGQEFDTWTGDTANLADPASPSTTLTMPAGGVTITARYKDLPIDRAPIYVDFGGTSLAPGNWNNISGEQAAIDGSIADMVDADGASTGVALQMTDAISGVNTSGTTSPDAALGFEANATRDSFWGCDITYSGELEPTAEFVLSGLDPEQEYILTFFASRMNVSDNRETEYSVTGQNSDTVYLDAANNADEDVSTVAITPNVSGEITVSMQKGPNNTNGYGFYYIGVLKIE